MLGEAMKMARNKRLKMRMGMGFCRNSNKDEI
jgi:hypothetical protein